MSDYADWERDDPPEPARAYARNTDPGTSWEAAGSLPPDKIRASQQAVLTVLSYLGPMDDTELLATYADNQARWGLPRQSASGIRTRRSELQVQGRVRDTGRRVTLASGRRAIIWEVV